MAKVDRTRGENARSEVDAWLGSCSATTDLPENLAPLVALTYAVIDLTETLDYRLEMIARHLSDR